MRFGKGQYKQTKPHSTADLHGSSNIPKDKASPGNKEFTERIDREE